MITLCDESNICDSLKYVSSELEILDYPEICYEEENERKALISIINTTWNLISEIKRLYVKGNEQTIELHKLKSLINSNSKAQISLGKELDKKKIESSAIKESLASALSLKKDMERELKTCKKEVNNFKKKIDILNVQYGKEILKKENIIANLKEKLNIFVNGNYVDVEETVVLPQFSQDIKTHSELQKYICILTNNIQMLILENANIRNLIVKILIEISNKCTKIKVKLDESELIQYLLNLSGENVIEKLEEKLQIILKQFKC